MPTYYDGTTPISIETTLAAGTHVLFTTPANKNSTISSLKINTPLANTVSLNIVRVSPAGTYNAYTFNLSAGDVLMDGSVYILKQGDSISLTISSGCTLFMVGQTVSNNPQTF